ncbi:hypothetical protein RI129_001995 [Pyrocoelia pectoralis]|uniref:MRH domain-containing protein n=1 Tax=Pyrocoelia pectoralis TaxID=417401 RepID=A0AAN7VV26_9COLE
MFLILRISFIFILLITQILSQQIFEDSYPTCVFQNEQDNHQITVMSKLWQIRGLNRYKDSIIKFSICDDKSTSIQDCDTGATACILNIKKKRNIKNAGSSFIYTKDDAGLNIFKSINGQLCDEEERFTTIIEFNSYPDILMEPKFKFMGECELRIEIPHPNFQPPCTLNKMGNLIDMRPLKNIQIEIEHPNTTMKFSLNVCKQSAKCDKDVSVCQLKEDGHSVAISDVNSQHIVYKDGAYSIQGHTTESRKKRLNFVLSLKCNWRADGIEKLMYVKPPQLGKMYRFSAESLLACVKLPMNCMVRDQSNENFLYDLRNLYRANGWYVKNVTDATININMCGPLYVSDSTNECAQQHSQVCLSNGTKVNLGTIQKKIEVSQHDTIITSLADGSICAANATKSYSTEIEFICKSVEEGPTLFNIDECVYIIKWYTPTACAKNAPVGNDCKISDLAGPINLKLMHQSEDKTHALSQNSYLRYNLCGSLKKPCNNNSDAAVCLIKSNKERVLGITNTTVSMNNQIISTNMNGEKCSGKISEIKINYHCNHLVSPNGQVQVNILRDSCDYEMNIYTPVACAPTSSFDCKFYKDNVLYDLSSLTRQDANYEIKHQNYLYSLNLCQSVIKTNNAQCSAYSGICMKNLTEMHGKKMYVSLGMVNSDLVPRVEDGDLIVEYRLGQLCYHDDNLSHRSSRIRFKCSNIDEGPKYVSESSCTHEFIWKTSKVCSRKVSKQQIRSLSSCSFVHPSTKQVIDLAKINTVIHFEGGNENFKLNICSSNFTYCPGKSGSNCSSLDSEFKVESTLYGPHFLYHLFNRSCVNDELNAVNISLSCEPTHTDVEFKILYIRNCTLYGNLNTNRVCIKMKEPEIVESSKHEPCIISDMDNFDLANLKNINVLSMLNNSYNFNFDGKGSNCNGLICKNGLSVISKNHLTCPIPHINFAESTVQLIYNSTLSCFHGVFQTEILVKCDRGSDVPMVVKENDCAVAVQYPLKEACSWFPQAQPSEILSADSSGIAVGTSIGVVLLLLLVGGSILMFKKRSIRRKALYNSISSDKECLEVYCKNAQL